MGKKSLAGATLALMLSAPVRADDAAAAAATPHQQFVAAARPAAPAAPEPATPVAATTVPEAQRTPGPYAQVYGKAGLVELGGSGGFAAASNYTRFELSPSFGVFVVDEIELSLLTAFNYFHLGSMDTHPSSSATEWKALVEPSYHLGFSREVFGFVGLGGGVSYFTGKSYGVAMQPRVGANFLIGRAGILTPSLNVAYSTVGALRTSAGTVLAVQTSYGLNIGYTVIW